MPTSKHWVINPSDELPPIVDEKGFGSRPPLTVIQMLKQTVNKFGSEKAYVIKRPVNVSNYFLLGLISAVISVILLGLGTNPRRLAILYLE
jgi:hypothetical protein